MPLKRLLLLAAVGTLLTGCSSTDREEEAATEAESPTSERADSSGRGNTSYVSVEFISAAIFSAGVWKPRVLRGRRLSCMATNSRSAAL